MACHLFFFSFFFQNKLVVLLIYFVYIMQAWYTVEQQQLRFYPFAVPARAHFQRVTDTTRSVAAQT